MKRRITLLFLLCPLLLLAQTYRHIGVESGLSSRMIYYIQKDQKGYMWFLTHEGIDRYDGKELKQYNLTYNDKELVSLQDLTWLEADNNKNLWVIGRKGKVFRYDQGQDRFVFVYEIPGSSDLSSIPVTACFIDNDHRIWLACGDTVFFYDIQRGKAVSVSKTMQGEITCVTRHGEDRFFVGTDTGIYHVEFTGDKPTIIPDERLEELSLQVNELYYDELTDQLFIGSFQKGIYVFDLKKEEYITPQKKITDINITRIRPLNKSELLISTDGMGVYKMNTGTYHSEPYIYADYDENNMMTGNTINDIYIDQDKRIWMANYPIGITVRDDRYSDYRLFRHSYGNSQSLINDHVNSIIEDSEGDLWFATNNGISLYEKKTNKWRSVLSSFNLSNKSGNNVFLSLCEVSPGVIYAGGYSSNVYKIHKSSMTYETPFAAYYKTKSTRTDKYIRSIIKDSQGYIWLGGYYYLQKVDISKREIETYPNVNNVTSITEKDDKQLWVGTTKGLYLVDKNTNGSQQIALPTESSYIHSLCQTRSGHLYIGTNGSGLLDLDIAQSTFRHYHKNNSALLSNNIYTLLTDGEDNVILSTGSGLTRYYPHDSDFHNWTKEQGLRTNHFNANSGVSEKSGHFIFGSSDGAVEIRRDLQLPRNYSSTMVFSDFKLFYQSVYPGAADSPLKKDIDQTEKLYLNSDQNIFSLKVSSINYDYPSNIVYSWKLEGFYDTWTRPSPENVIRFTNLSPGQYTLCVRAISKENQAVVEQRSMEIVVRKPFSRSIWAIIIYAAIAGGIIIFLIRYYYLKKQRKVTDEKIQFFINTAHDIRTPLTLIKAPLEDINDREFLSENGKKNMSVAMRNVNVLLDLTTNLLNFERVDLYSSTLNVSEYELNTFMKEVVGHFYSFADKKQIDLTYDRNFQFLNVWFDKEKMESILKNILSNALKYTGEEGKVEVYASETSSTWSVEIKDNGIGIPAEEQKKIFKAYFRGSNAINSKITGSGIGMILVSKMVKLHKGKISFDSTENKGTSIKVTFPKGNEHFAKEYIMNASAPSPEIIKKEGVDTPVVNEVLPARAMSTKGKRILVVEDNDELRAYLRQTLSEEYYVTVCENGKEALRIVNEFKPDLVITDVMMPELRGDELCVILKNNIETSHIPIILLTALNNEKSILQGIQTGADEFIIKPFNIGILKATIANLLRNRSILKNKFANLEFSREDEGEVSCINCNTDIDWKFMNDLKGFVEKNIEDPSFNIDVLCSLMNMSRTSLYSKIKALTDLTPSDYVRHIRLNKAAQLLTEGRYNVTEVAELTGFNDAKYFREVFKKHFNVSPSKYKG